MKNSKEILLKLASKFQNKYASIDASTLRDEIQKQIQTAIGNASAQPSSGIMPFLKLLEQNQASLAIDVTRDGNRISVSAPGVNPTTLTPVYAALPQQIKAYLEKYIEVFPSRKDGETIDYDNLTIRLTYPSAIDRGVAQK